MIQANNSSSAQDSNGMGYFILSYDSCLIVLGFLIIAINILVIVLFVRRRPLPNQNQLTSRELKRVRSYDGTAWNTHEHCM